MSAFTTEFIKISPNEVILQLLPKSFRLLFLGMGTIQEWRHRSIRKNKKGNKDTLCIETSFIEII